MQRSAIDFGVARHFKPDQSKDTAYYYSVGYAPPEQYGQVQTGPRTDIYSLGVTLYQMLTGHEPASKPFHFPALQILDPTIPVPLAKLVTHLLELDEKNRPATISLVKQELQKLLSGPSVAPTQPPLPVLPWENRLAKALASPRTWRAIGSILAMSAGGFLCVQFRTQVTNDGGLNAAPYILLVGGLSLVLAGLAFLLPSQRVLAVGKGMVLVLAGCGLLLPIYRDASANDGASLLNNAGTYKPLVVGCLILGTALAFLGACWIWRSANLATGIIFGALVALLGILFLLISDTSYVASYLTQFLTDPYRYNLALLACTCQIVLGIITPLMISLRLQKARKP